MTMFTSLFRRRSAPTPAEPPLFTADEVMALSDAQLAQAYVAYRERGRQRFVEQRERVRTGQVARDAKGRILPAGCSGTEGRHAIDEGDAVAVHVTPAGGAGMRTDDSSEGTTR